LDSFFEDEDGLTETEKEALIALYDSPAVGYAKRLSIPDHRWKMAVTLEHPTEEDKAKDTTVRDQLLDKPAIAWPPAVNAPGPDGGDRGGIREVMDPGNNVHPATGADALRQRRSVNRSWNDLIYEKKFHLPPESRGRPLPPKKGKKKKNEQHTPVSHRPQGAPPPPVFGSNFECGNLSRVIQVSENEFDMEASADFNTNGHTQWYYFSVEGCDPNREYVFNIINFEKSSSLYNEGLQPVIRSGNSGTWKRSGHSVWYGKNQALGKDYDRKYTLSFHIKVPDSGINYMAYSIPYGLSDLRGSILKWLECPMRSKYISHAMLCTTMGGIDLDLLTITDGDISQKEKQIAAISARVHPGEVNSSWMMHGAIEFLLSDEEEAKELRRRYIWKVVPMLNPDGVVLGNYRCSMAGLDLNRQWREPSATITPCVYYLKRLLKEIHTQA